MSPVVVNPLPRLRPLGTAGDRLRRSISAAGVRILGRRGYGFYRFLEWLENIKGLFYVSAKGPTVYKYKFINLNWKETINGTSAK